MIELTIAAPVDSCPLAKDFEGKVVNMLGALWLVDKAEEVGTATEPSIRMFMSPYTPEDGKSVEEVLEEVGIRIRI